MVYGISYYDVALRDGYFDYDEFYEDLYGDWDE